MLSEGAEKLLEFIRLERQRNQDRRRRLMSKTDGFFDDVPDFYINDLCLLLLVSLRHELDRELASLAARLGLGTIDAEHYTKRRIHFSHTSEYERNVKTALGLADLSGYEQMEMLRHIANSYKHNAFTSASTSLLRHLNLSLDLKYAPLVGSHSIRTAICRDLGIETTADWFQLTEVFIARAKQFLTSVDDKNRGNLAKIKHNLKGFLNPENALH